MMVKCVVQGCINHRDLRPGERSSRPHKRFFRFPKDKARMKVWLAALRETEREITDQHQICEDHFLSHHITPSGISPEAIPIMPPSEGLVSGWSSCEEQDELSDPVEEGGVDAEDDLYDVEFEDYEEEDEDHSLADNGPYRPFYSESLMNNPNNNNVNQAMGASSKLAQYRSDVALGQLTKRFMQLLHSAPNGVLDLNEVTRKLGTRKRRVYDITNVLTGIQIIKKTSKNKIQRMNPASVNQWSAKTKADLLHLKSTEEALDLLIKDCAQQLFALTDLKDNADSAYVTYEDICQIDVFKDQTIIAIRAPEETKLEVPTPTEESIQIHLKGCRGPIQILTCETEGPSEAVDPTNTESKLVKPACFLTLEESRIHTQPLLSGIVKTSRKFKYQRRADSSAAEHCCVPMCSASSKFNSVLSFHTFPTDEEMRKKWICSIQRKDLIITSHMRVCSRHFKSEDVKEPLTPTGRRMLKKGAVPTLFQWNNYSAQAPLQRRKGSTPVDEDPAPVDYAAVDIALDRAAE
ncbi:transcription factor E2f1-like isoform X1 [Carassius auratus]|uniref:Transcription factor E2f1-like isoform X1 n=1 Tax=Carassius auratus TaxID=7957 RepID=A0A6P6LW23_CARAU|nr:transcription factor E2f1-like isoform X1 [Carassius auratus]